MGDLRARGGAGKVSGKAMSADRAKWTRESLLQSRNHFHFHNGNNRNWIEFHWN